MWVSSMSKPFSGCLSWGMMTAESPMAIPHPHVADAAEKYRKLQTEIEMVHHQAYLPTLSVFEPPTASWRCPDASSVVGWTFGCFFKLSRTSEESLGIHFDSCRDFPEYCSIRNFFANFEFFIFIFIFEMAVLNSKRGYMFRCRDFGIFVVVASVASWWSLFF